MCFISSLQIFQLTQLLSKNQRKRVVYPMSIKEIKSGKTIDVLKVTLQWSVNSVSLFYCSDEEHVPTNGLPEMSADSKCSVLFGFLNAYCMCMLIVSIASVE